MPRSVSTSDWRRRTSAARRRTRTCWLKRASSRKPTRARSSKGLDQVLAEIEAGNVQVLERARRRAHECRKPLEGSDRTGGRTAAYGALAQRSGGDGFPALCPRLHRRYRCGAGGRAAGARRKSRSSCGDRHAGLHASAAGAAGHVRPSSSRLRRDDRRAIAAGLPMRGSGSTNVRSARRRSPERRSRSTGTKTAEGARLRQADGQLARWRLRPRFRARDAGGGGDRGRAFVAPRRRDRDLDDAAVRLREAFGPFTTGSSIMPQKRNPDAAELARAKVGRIAGAFQGLVIVMKGLPLAYSKDMQEDKEATFDALASLRLVMAAMAGMVADLEPVPEAMRAAAGARLRDGDRSGRLAGRGAQDAVPRRAPRHGRHRQGRRGERRRSRRICRCPTCRRSSRALRKPYFRCSLSKIRSKAGRAMGELRHRTSPKWRVNG